MATKLTKNFNREEFDCKNGVVIPEKYHKNLRMLAENLQVLRNYLGEPVSIISGYRTPAYNKKIGGVAYSKHLSASAADITVKSKTPQQLAGIIEMLIKDGHMRQGGIGVYPGFVHYDIRGFRARW